MKKRFFFVAICMTVTTLAFGQRARMFTPENGLQNTQVNKIYQDPSGFMWVCTEGGLLRFDGVGFETFTHDGENPNSIYSESVHEIYEAPDGKKWVGTASGLDLFDSDYNIFRHFDLKDARIPSSEQFISCLTGVPDRVSGNLLFVGTEGYGVYVIDLDTQNLLNEKREKIFRSLKNEFVKTLFLDSSRRLWIITEDQTQFCVLDVDTLEPADNVSLSPDLTRESGVIRVNCIAEDPIGKNIIIGTSSHGTLVYDSTTGLIRKAISANARSLSISSIIYNTFSEQEGGKGFLVSDEKYGIALFDMATENILEANLPEAQRILESKKAEIMVKDGQGNLWLGIYQNGIAVVPMSMFGFSYMGFSIKGIPGENSACVMSIHEDAEGNLWVATDGAGIFRQSGQNSFLNYNRDNSGLTNNSIMALAEDRYGNIWIGTYQDGLFYWNKNTGIRKFPDSGNIRSERIRVLEYDSSRDLLYAGTHGAGMVVIDPGRKTVVSSNIVEDDDLWVSTLHIDGEGTLWVGTYNGPKRWDPDTGQLQTYEIIQDKTRTRTYAISSSPDGTIWFGTGEGLFASKPSTKEVRQYTERDGLSNNNVRDILVASSGELWISTANGLSRLSPQNNGIINYHAYDGLQGNEFRSGAAFKSPSGKLYFGGTGGVTAFSPVMVDGSSHRVPQVFLSRLEMLDKEIKYDPSKGASNLIDKHISEATSITIPSDVDLFSLGFSVPEYTNPQRIVYSYRLVGFDSGWKSVPASLRMATYTNVPPGKYTFEVRAYFEGFTEEFSQLEVSMKVEYPWYRTFWAYCIYLAILSMIIFTVIRQYHRRKAQEDEKQKAELKELRLGLFTNLTHEIRTPLNLVMGPLGSMREAEMDSSKKDTYNLMYRNCLRINRIVNQLMDIQKVDAGQMPMHFRETDLVFFIKDVMQSFQNLAKTKKISFTLSSAHEEESLWIDQGNFDKIIYNILSNAFKHTPDGGKIKVGISAPKVNRGVLDSDIKEYVEVDIFNSGSRIEEEYLTRIFDRFVQVNPYDANTGSGVGLNLTKLLVELHHGQITAGNEEDGVVFKVLFPVGKDHLSDEELSVITRNQDLYVKKTESLVDSHEDETFAVESSDEKRIAAAKRNVIVIEDDPETREYLRALLQVNYNVTACNDAEEAWPLITTTLPDAVVSDLVLPGMTGNEICSKIRHNQTTNHIPVIILTGQNGEKEEQEASDSGADKFLSKPISVELLLSNIAQVISSRETMKGKLSSGMNYDYAGIKMDSADEKLIKRIVDSIRRHIEDPDFDVSALCNDVGISRVHLNRKLKENGNVPPSVLIKSFRMKQAAYLLINKKVNVSEVAYRVGFSSHSYFSSAFKEYFGMSPREFVAKFIDHPDDPDLRKMFGLLDDNQEDRTSNSQ